MDLRTFLFNFKKEDKDKSRTIKHRRMITVEAKPKKKVKTGKKMLSIHGQTTILHEPISNKVTHRLD